MVVWLGSLFCADPQVKSNQEYQNESEINGPNFQAGGVCMRIYMHLFGLGLEVCCAILWKKYGKVPVSETSAITG